VPLRPSWSLFSGLNLTCQALLSVTNHQTFFRSPKVLKLKLESKQNQLSWRAGLETTDAEGKKSLTLPDFVNSTLYHKLNLCNGLSLKDFLTSKLKVF